MKKIVLILILLSFSSILYADLKSELEYYIRSNGNISGSQLDHKCATRYHFLIQQNWNILDAEVQSQYLTKMIQPPTRERSMLTPSGHFMLHWDETTFHAVPPEDLSANGIPDYIDSAMVIFDHVWDVEINQLGFQPPLDTDGTPVQVYHIYFSNLSAYGITTFDGFLNDEIPSIPGIQLTSYIEIENDFAGSAFNTHGLDALRVTAAHEFNHAIQLTYNLWLAGGWPVDFYFFEMTSTWLEEILYPEVNDYLAYLDYFFDNVSGEEFNSFNYLYPYGNCLYLHMLEKQFGVLIVSDIWEKIKIKPSLPAITDVLALNGSSWQKSLAEYGVWLFYTGTRANTTTYFPEGDFYPMINILGIDNHIFAKHNIIPKIIKQNAVKYLQISNMQNTSIRSLVKADQVGFGGHQLMSQMTVSDFFELNNANDNYLSTEESVVAALTNSSNSSDNFTFFLDLSFSVEVEYFDIQSDEAQNIVSWNVKYEAMIKDWIISRKQENDTPQEIARIPGKKFSTQPFNYRYNDTNIKSGVSYTYFLETEFLNDSIAFIDSSNVVSLQPSAIKMLPNFPNPFQSKTTITISISKQSKINLAIYNVLGEKIKILQSDALVDPDYYRYVWNGDDEKGEMVSTGVYFAVIKTNTENYIKKVLIVR